MVHSSAWNRRKHYGNPPAWQRPHNAAYPRRAPASDRLPSVLGPALRHQPQDCGQVARAPRCSMSPWVLGAEQASIFPKSKNTWRLLCASKGICRWTISWGNSWRRRPSSAAAPCIDACSVTESADSPQHTCHEGMESLKKRRSASCTSTAPK